MNWDFWTDFITLGLDLPYDGIAVWFLDNGMRVLVGLFPFIVIWKVIKFILGASYK